MLNKIKVFIILTLLSLGILLIPNLKSADASSKQDYTLTTPPQSYEVGGELLDIIYIKYDLTYYEADNLYYLKAVEVRINDGVETKTYSATYNNYLPSNIKYIGLYFTPPYNNGADNVMQVELYYRESLGSGDILIKSDFMYLTQISQYLVGTDLFAMTFTDISTQYNLGYENGKKDSFIEGYDKGYSEGLAVAENDFFSLFTGIADTPFMIITSLLSFEIFGVSAFVVLFSILTICIIIWLISKFMI